MKGAKSRSGGGPRPGYEGGQLPLIKKLPMKRGFTNIFRTEYSVVNLGNLEVFSKGSDVTLEAMKKAGLIKNLRCPVKVLANGDISKPLTVHAQRFSAEARKKIEAAGGKVQEL
jgi:large subunit ribosomal protein L15